MRRTVGPEGLETQLTHLFLNEVDRPTLQFKIGRTSTNRSKLQYRDGIGHVKKGRANDTDPPEQRDRLGQYRDRQILVTDVDKLSHSHARARPGPIPDRAPHGAARAAGAARATGWPWTTPDRCSTAYRSRRGAIRFFHWETPAPCAHAEQRNISGPYTRRGATMLCSQDCHCIRLRKAPLMKRDKRWIPLLDNVNVEA